MKYQAAPPGSTQTTDMLPGANRQWFTTQGGVWGKGTDGNVAWATVDAQLITLEDINRGLWPESIQIHNGSVFSYVMNNYWYTDAPAQQGGRFTFRYAADQRAGSVSQINRRQWPPNNDHRWRRFVTTTWGGNRRYPIKVQGF